MESESATSPKTTCFPSNQLVSTVVMKNCEPFLELSVSTQLHFSNTYVFGPAFAILSNPGRVCLILKFSSANFSPYIDFPPVPCPKHQHLIIPLPHPYIVSGKVTTLQHELRNDSVKFAILVAKSLLSCT